MSARTTRKDLERLLDQVVTAMGRPKEHWRKREGGYAAVIGSMHLDHAGVYGGWDLCEIMEGGGEDSLIGNTFAGRGRLRAHEMETFLLGMLAMAERMKAAEVRT